ncbi:hypothetical protein [uncultured Flavobacterium sp.]|uniref:hypothetical protein n=1 Tax=uncultured Flavobacterium sp. TaxID=165435 RepID=UPI0025961192|nr:hypothetical protein [uncultured Flavobacterium sp.]
MESVKVLKENMDRELKRDTRRTFYGIALLLIVYGAGILSYMFFVADYNIVLNTSFIEDAYKTFFTN